MSEPTDATINAIVEAAGIMHRLEDVYTEDGRRIWLRGRNRNLGGRSPWDLLLAGEYEAVEYEVARLCGDGNAT